ncbi:hypothetical protein PR048_014244 [Dryococelus australis]|uniref:Uncharacterized protein n=1 Tax=Dryococelus australis TaxID=614101 RepID=A0ABQ9HDN5_9NEOP|nr:hypothetical protein PR048_014244 [Dryococelus australis]
MIENMDDIFVSILPFAYSLSCCDKTSKIGTKHMNFDIALLDEEMVQNTELFIAKVLVSSKINSDEVRYK